MAGEAELWAKGLAGADPAGASDTIASPVADALVNGWTTDTGATTNLFAAINEAVANDGDYIRSPLSPTGSPSRYEVVLSPVIDPGVHTGHVVRYRYRRNPVGNPLTAGLYLYEGTTLRDSWLLGDPLPSTFTTGQRTLSEAIAANIGSYGNLRLHIVPNESAMTAPTLVAAGSFTQTATNGAGMAPTLPSGWAADDIHVLVASRKDTTVNMTALSGWTQALASNSGTTNRTEVWWRRAVAGDAQPTVTFGSGTVLREVQIFGIRGCPTSGSPFAQTSGAVDAISIRANASSTTVATTDVTPATASFGLFVYAASSGPTSATQPSGWSTFTTNRSGNNGIGLGYATRTYATGGAYGAPTTTIQQAGVNHGVLLAFAGKPSTPSRFEVAWVELEVPALPIRSVSGAGVAQRATGAPSGKPVALDSFVGAAAELSTHTANTGQSWAQHPTSSVPTSLSGDGQVAVASGWSIYWLNAVPSSPDYEVATDVTLTVPASATYAGVLLRASPTVATWYYAFYYRATNVVAVHKSVAGTSSELNSAARTFTVGQPYRLRATVSGGATTTIRIYIDDVLALTATDSSSPITTVGSAGFMTSGEGGTGVRLDNFAVYEPVTSAVLHIISLSGAATARPATGAGTGLSAPQPRALSGARAAQSATASGTGVRHRNTTSGAATAQAATGAGAGISGKSTLSGSQRVQSATASGTGLRHRNTVSGAGVAQPATGPLPGGTTAVANDTFTGAATELAGTHTSDSGHAWAIHPLTSGTVSLTGSGALAIPNAEVLYTLAATPPSADYEASVRLAYTNAGSNGYAGILIRCNPSGTPWYYVHYSRSSGAWIIAKQGAGTLASYAQALTVSQFYTLRATVSGGASTTIKLFVDGVERASYTDSSTPVTATGRAGFAANGESGAGIVLDDFSVAVVAGSANGITHRNTTSGGAVAQRATGTAPTAPVGSDSFTGSAVELSLHTSDSGHAWVQHPIAFGPVALSGTGALNMAQDLTPYFLDAAPPSADYEASLDFTYDDDGIGGHVGLLLRVNPTAATWYGAYHSSYDGGYFIDRAVGGGSVALAFIPATLNPNQSYRLRATVEGSGSTTIRLYLDGALVGSVTDATPITPTGRAGVLGYATGGTGTQVDNFVVGTLAGPTSITHRSTISGAQRAQSATGAGPGIGGKTTLSGAQRAQAATGTGAGTLTLLQESTAASAVNEAGSGTSHTSRTAALPNPVTTAGGLLLAWVAVDKASGAFTTPSGFTPLGSYVSGTDISYAMYYRTAQVGDQFVGFSWATSALLSHAYIAEFAGYNPATPPVVAQASSATTAVTSLASGALAAAAAGSAFALYAADSWGTTSAGQTVHSWTNGYATRRHTGNTIATSIAHPWVAFATRAVAAAAEALATTHTYERSDQAAIAVVAFAGVGAAIIHRNTVSGAAQAQAATASGAGIHVVAPSGISGGGQAQRATGSGLGVRHRNTVSGSQRAQAATASGTGLRVARVVSGSQRAQAATASGTGLRHRNAVSGSATAQAATGSGVGVHVVAPVGFSGAAVAQRATGAGVSSGPPLGASSFAIQNYADASTLGPDGYTWAQAYPIVVDKYGKIVALRQKHNAGIRFAYSNDGGATWGQSATEINFITRGSIAYDSRNDIFHVLWAATGGSDGTIYRRYTPTRDGSNNLTGLTQVSGVNLQLEADGSIITMQPILLWLGDADYGTYGALVAIWTTSNATNGQVHASMRVLSNTTADNTGANWRRLDGGTTGDAALITSTYGVPTTAVSAAQASHVGVAALRKRGGAHAGDLYVAYAVNGGDCSWRRFPWQAGTDNWGTPTTAAVLFDLSSGSGDPGGQAWELLSKWAEDTGGDAMYLGGARWDGATNGETWSVYRVSAADASAKLADTYSVGGQFLPADYALTGDIVFDNTSGRLISAHVPSGVGSNDAVLKVYERDGTLVQTSTVFSAADVDIPLLWQDPASGDCRYGSGNGSLLVIFRDTDGYPATAPPYRGWFGTVALAGLESPASVTHRNTLSGAATTQATGTGGGISTGPPPTRTISGSAVAQPATASGLGLRQRRTTSGVAVAARATGAGAGLRQQRTTSGSAVPQPATGSGLGLRHRGTVSGASTAQAASGSGLGLRQRATVSGAGQAQRATGAGAGLTFRTRASGAGLAQAATSSGLGLRHRGTLSGTRLAQPASGTGAGIHHRGTLAGVALAQAATGEGVGITRPAPSGLSGSARAQRATGAGVGLRQRNTAFGSAQAQPAAGAGVGVQHHNSLSGTARAQSATGAGAGLRQQRTTSGSATAQRATGAGFGVTFQTRLAGLAQAQPATATGVGIRQRFTAAGSATAQRATSGGPGIRHRQTLSGAAQTQATGGGPGLQYRLRLSGSAQAARATGTGLGVKADTYLSGAVQARPATGLGPGIRQRRTLSGLGYAQRATGVGSGLTTRPFYTVTVEGAVVGVAVLDGGVTTLYDLDGGLVLVAWIDGGVTTACRLEESAVVAAGRTDGGWR